MKKIFLYAMLALGAGLSACTTKDPMEIPVWLR